MKLISTDIVKLMLKSSANNLMNKKQIINDLNVFPVPDEEAARYLVSCGLKGVGIDALSVDRIESEHFPVHKILLNGGLVTVENLCLKKLVGRKNAMFFALPLKFLNADGAPVRAIAEFRDFSEEESDSK